VSLYKYTQRQARTHGKKLLHVQPPDKLTGQYPHGMRNSYDSEKPTSRPIRRRVEGKFL
jgi:hypothetical protein